MHYTRRRRYGETHIGARLRQIDDLLACIAGYAEELGRDGPSSPPTPQTACGSIAISLRALPPISKQRSLHSPGSRSALERALRLPRCRACRTIPARHPSRSRTSLSRCEPTNGVGPLLFEQHEARLSALECLPRSLWLGSLINSQGSLEPRLCALQGLRVALLAGGRPDPAGVHWPDAALAAELHADPCSWICRTCVASAANSPIRCCARCSGIST